MEHRFHFDMLSNSKVYPMIEHMMDWVEVVARSKFVIGQSTRAMRPNETDEGYGCTAVKSLSSANPSLSLRTLPEWCALPTAAMVVWMGRLDESEVEVSQSSRWAYGNCLNQRSNGEIYRFIIQCDCMSTLVCVLCRDGCVRFDWGGVG